MSASGLNDGCVTEFVLGEAQRDEVRAAALRAAGVPLAELTPESFPLPTAGAVLRKLAREVTGGAGFALLHGVPVGDDPDLICAGLGCYAGRIVLQGAQQVPVVHVRDQGADPGAATTRSYEHSGALGYHADPADIVALLCVRPAKSGGLSTIVRSAAVHDELLRARPDLTRVLYEPWWRDLRTGDGPGSFCQSPVYARDDRGRLSEDAARLAARVWTVTATAEMAGLNVLAYLTAYLDECGRNHGKPPAGPDLERFLPWRAASEDLRAWAQPPAPG